MAEDKPKRKSRLDNIPKEKRGDLNLFIKGGKSPNPNGRPNGQRNYATLYREALMKLAELNGKEPDELEVEMLSNAIKKARAGDYKFYKDVLDRIHGTALNKTDITTNGKDLPQPIYGGKSGKDL
jgi:hypothetical protein